MFCNQCGEPLPKGSRFCNSCGAAIAARAETDDRPRRGLEARPHDVAEPGTAFGLNEEVIFTIRPTLISVYVWYVVAAMAVLLVSALMGLAHSWSQTWFTGWVALFVILGVALVAFAVPIYKHILGRREVYTLTNHKLEMRYGLIAKTVQSIRLTKIQEVTVTNSVWQRLLKLGNIEIESASEMGKTTLAQIRNPDRYANMILSELRRRN